ncbi:MAG: hypothetical protein JWQ14_2683 [Adhaeribacter sp.]|nr:hypothetical protein [Adhaeribacter sp.]
MKFFIFLITVFFVMTACKKEEVAVVERAMRVNYYRQSCQGAGALNCYLVQEGAQVGTINWNLFYNEIIGFIYEAGFIYTLKVKVEKITNPLADGSDRKYMLVEVVSKEKV